MTEKNVETPPETEAETLQHTDVETTEETDDYLNPTTINSMIQLRIDKGLSLREISEESGISLPTVSRILKGITTKLDSSEPHVDPDEKDESIDGEAHSPVSPSTPESPRPSGRIEVSQQLWDQLDDLDKKSLKGWKTNVLAWNDLQRQNRNNGHDGHSVPSYGSGHDELERAKARFYDSMSETEEIERLEDVRQRRIDRHTKTETKGESEAVKDLKQELRDIKQSIQNNPQGLLKIGVDAVKAGMDAVPRTQGVDPNTLVNTYRAGIQDARESQVTANQTNVLDLKKEEMKQLERLENRKLDFAERQYDRKEAKGDQYVELIKDGLKTISSGPIGRAIESVGQGAKNRLERGGQPSVPKVAQIDCPNCKGKFPIIEGAKAVVCPGCQAVLQLQQQPQAPMPQPSQQPSPQAEEPQPEATQQSTEEQKPEQAQEQAPEPPKHMDVTS